MTLGRLIFLLSATLLLGAQTVAQTKVFKNLEPRQKQLGFSELYSQRPQRILKIAVLDKSFDGYQQEVGKTLPSSTTYIAGPIAAPAELKSEHGLKMAQILTAFLTNEMTASALAPDLRLYNVFGYSNFKAAIDDVISQKVDIVLYSEVWEFGGNFDGAGFINAQVNRATQAGVVWVNAAGNFNLTTYNSKIETSDDDWVKLPDQNKALSVRCTAKDEKKCPLKVVLSWNDFKDTIEEGTDKDLDLVLADDLLNVVEVSSLRQYKSTSSDNRPGSTKYSRETISTQIKAGLYLIRVKNVSKNFRSSDQLRITIDGEFISMPSHSSKETLLNPADNKSVITVGALDSDRSSVSESLNKPDILTESSLLLLDGSEFRGSSNSAAIVAAGIAIRKGQKPEFNSQQLLASVLGGKATSATWTQTGLPLAWLGFIYTGPGCFLQGDASPFPDYIKNALRPDMTLVLTNSGYRIMSAFDPIALAQSYRRYFANDMVTLTPRGIEVYLRNAVVPRDAIEVFQRPLEAGLCVPSTGTSSTHAKAFHL